MSEAPPVPQHCPSPRELDDLELILNGALGLDGFEGPSGSVTLTVPADVAGQVNAVGAIELVDPEGLPLAHVDVTATHLTDAGPAGGVLVEGPATKRAKAAYGPFRRLYLTPGQTTGQYAGRTIVPVAGALTESDLATICRERSDKGVLLLALAGHGTPEGLSPVGLIRATRTAADLLARDGVTVDVVVAPLASRGPGHPEADRMLGERVVDAYAEGPVLAVPGRGALPDAIADVVDADAPAPGEQGLVVFFTGLSGSGKSTIARALLDHVLERGERTVTSLDGDVVRRNLSAGLTFSKADRETNIRRIGWVAAEIARHHGLAIVSPIAPFAETREAVRQMVTEAGGAFVLIHVATPLEECERRDRKGLYAKARRGEIPEFTGISSPYEEPDAPTLRLDTTDRTIEDCLDEVLTVLRREGHLS
ncbi:adenylyl-sulfate kinase [Nocardioidaceae bacterium]|nr:adenylyl-sulfate kinase [Nocardioidaceae bacterium]